MKLLLIILIVIIIYLNREVVILKSHISDIPKQVIQSTNIQPVSSPYPRLLQWSSEISPNGRYSIAAYTGDYADRYHYYQLFITDLTNDRMHRIYTGDYRTIDWEWTEDNQLKVTYNCGTGCKTTRIIAVNDYVSFESDQGSNWKLE